MPAVSRVFLVDREDSPKQKTMDIHMAVDKAIEAMPKGTIQNLVGKEKLSTCAKQSQNLEKK